MAKGDENDDLLKWADSLPKAEPTTPTMAVKPSGKSMKDLAKGSGFTITSTTGGKHNTGSLHYSGRAIDVRTRDKTPDQIDAFKRQMEGEGFRVRDERTRPQGQKVWGGPHLHVEDRGGRISPTKPVETPQIDEKSIWDDVDSILTQPQPATIQQPPIPSTVPSMATPPPTMKAPIAPIGSKPFSDGITIASPVPTPVSDQLKQAVRGRLQQIATPGIAQAPDGMPPMAPTAVPPVSAKQRMALDEGEYQKWLADNQFTDAPGSRESFLVNKQAEAQAGQVQYEQPQMAQQPPKATQASPTAQAPATQTPTARVNWASGTGKSAKTFALDEAASQISAQLGVDYDTVRTFFDQKGVQGLTDDVAERRRKDRLETIIDVDDNAVRQIKAMQEQADKAKRRQSTQEATAENQVRQYIADGEIDSVAQLLAAKDVGVKDIKGRSIDEIIQEERDAFKRFRDTLQNDPNEYNRILQSEQARLSAGESPEKIVQERWAKDNQARIDAVRREIAEKRLGSFVGREKEQKRIADTYGENPLIGNNARPMARPAEFVLNIAREFAKLPGQAANLVGMGADAMSAVGIDPKDNPFLQFGEGWKAKIDASANKDLKDEMIVGDVSRGLAQLMQQTILVPFTGGASILLPAAQAAESQYLEAAKDGAGRNARIGSALVGAIMAVPDAWLEFQFLKGLSPAAKVGFLENLSKDLFEGLASKMSKDEAKQATIAAVGEFIAKAPVGYFGEKYQEQIEDIGNKAFAKVTYKDKLTWKDVFQASEREQQGYESAGLVGIFGAGGGSITNYVNRLSDAELMNATPVLDEALKKGTITPEQRNAVDAAVFAEAQKRKISLEPIKVQDKKGNQFTVVEDQGEKLKVKDEKGSISVRNKDRLTPINEKQTEVPAQSASVEPPALAKDKPVESADAVPGEAKPPMKRPGGDLTQNRPIPAVDRDEETASWVIKNKETGETVMETFDPKKVEALNTDKYEAVPIQEHLGNLNKEIATKPESVRYHEKRPKGMVDEAPLRPETLTGAKNRIGELETEVQEERRKADTNPLTGLGSKNAWAKAKDRIEADTNQEIVSFDVNRMKEANDTTSHDTVDDKVLKRLGEVTQQVLEKNGIETRNAFTPGGDELYVALPKGRAAQIRDEIEKAFGTVELTVEKDYTNQRTGETFKKGDRIPVTLSGEFGQTVAEAEKGLGTRKDASKKANPVKRATTAKEPWQMTAKEWDAEFEKGKPSSSGSHSVTAAANIGKSQKGAENAFDARRKRIEFLKMGLPDFDAETGLPWKDGPKTGLQSSARHRQVIEHAIKQGLPVPAEVLADYPDLAPKKSAKQRLAEKAEPKGKKQAQTVADVPVLPKSEQVDPDADPTAKEARESVKDEKINPRTGLTKTQTEYLAKELQDLAHDALKKGIGHDDAGFEQMLLQWKPDGMPESVFGRTGIEMDESIKVPGDGSFKVHSVEAANRLHQKITGKPIEGFDKASKASIPSFRPTFGPSTAAQDDQMNLALRLYGTPERAIAFLTEQREQLSEKEDEKARKDLDSVIAKLNSELGQTVSYKGVGEPLTSVGREAKATADTEIAKRREGATERVAAAYQEVVDRLKPDITQIRKFLKEELPKIRKHQAELHTLGSQNYRGGLAAIKRLIESRENAFIRYQTKFDDEIAEQLKDVQNGMNAAIGYNPEVRKLKLPENASLQEIASAVKTQWQTWRDVIDGESSYEQTKKIRDRESVLRPANTVLSETVKPDPTPTKTSARQKLAEKVEKPKAEKASEPSSAQSKLTDLQKQLETETHNPTVHDLKRRIAIQENIVAYNLPFEIDPEADFPLEATGRAFQWNSMDPDRRARGVQRDYVEVIGETYKKLAPLAKTPEQQAILDAEIQRFRDGYIQKERAVLSATGKTASSMVTGPARFPVEKNRRALDRERAVSDEALDWRKRAVASIEKKLLDARTDEVKTDERWGDLKAKIDRGFTANIAGVIERLADNGEVELVNRALDYMRSMAKPPFTQRHKVWGFGERAEKAAAKVKPTGSGVIAEFDGGTVVNNRDAERVQILFDERPSPEVITILKKSGWRWSPSNSAWQRQNTQNGLMNVDYVLKKAGFEVRKPESGNVSLQMAADGDYEAAIRDAAEGTLTDPVFVAQTSPILAKIGLPSLPIVVTPKVLEKTFHGKHSDKGITPDNLIQMRPDMARPIAVLNSDNADAPAGSVLLVLPTKTAQGEFLTVAIHPNQKMGRWEVNRIASIHSRNLLHSFGSWGNKGLFRYLDKKQSRRLATTYGSNFASVVQSINDSTDNLLSEDDFVNNNESLQMEASETNIQRFKDVQYAHTQTILEGAKSEVKVVAGATVLELNEEAAELARRLESSLRNADTSPFFGTTHTDRTLKGLAEEAKKWALHYENNSGYTTEQVASLRKLADDFTELAKEAHGVAYVFDFAIPHETHHKLVLDALGGKKFPRKAIEKLKALDIWNDKGLQRILPTGEKRLFHLDYGKVSQETKALELAAQLETGEIVHPDKDKFLEIFADGILDVTTELDPVKFARVIQYANTQTSDTGRDRAERTDADENERADGRDTASGEGARDRTDTTAERDGGRTADDANSDGRQKVSQTPKSLRGKADIPVDDRTYTGVTNKGQQAFSDAQMDKGVEEADRWFNENADDNNLNGGSTAVVGLNLLNHYAKTRQFKEMNAVADKLVPMVTQAAQTVQAMAVVSAFNPQMAAAYAAKVKKQKQGKDLTPAEAEKAERIAQNLSETAQAEGLSEAALKQAEQFIKELEKEVEQANTSIQTLEDQNKTIKVNLEEARKVVRSQKAQIARLTNDKPRTPKAAVVKDLRARKDDILTKLAEKYGTPSLQMVAPSGSLQMAADSSLDPDLIDWATLTLGENWSTISVGQFKNLANQITNGALSENEINELHASAVEALRSDRTQSDDQKSAFKTRSEHLRAARKFRKGQMPNIDKTAAAIMRQGVEGNYSDDAIIFALARKKHVKPEDAMNEYRQRTGEKPSKDTMAEAHQLILDTKRAIASDRMQARSDVTLTKEDMDAIREERRVNRASGAREQKIANAFYEGLAKTPYEVSLESVVNLRRANLLTGVKTHLRNVVSNAGFAASEEVSRPLAWLADAAVSGLTGERTVHGMSPKAVYKAFESLVREDDTFKNINRESGLRMAKQILVHGATFDELAKQQHSRSILGEKIGKPGAALDAYVNKVFDALGAEDAVFKTYAFRRSLEEQAKTMTADKDERLKLILNPTNTMQQIASDYADFATFTNDNILSNLIRSAKAGVAHQGKGGQAVKAVFETVVPYDRTPTNIFIRVVEHSPLGLVSAGAKLKNLKQEPSKAFRNKYRAAIELDLNSTDDFLALPRPRQRKLIDEGLQKVWTRQQQQDFARTFGRASLGTGTFALGFFLAAAGLLTGSMSPEDDDREETNEFFKRREMGVENRSLLIPGVGRFVLTDDPLSKVLAAGATAYEQTKADRGAPVASAWNGAKEVAEDAMFEQPLVGGVNSLYKQIKGAKFGEFAGSLVGTTLIPTFVNDIGEVADAKARTGSGYRPGEKRSILNTDYQARGFKNSLLKRVPIARNYAVDEAQGVVPPEVRGGVLRRMVRAIDLFNTRPPVEYEPLTAPENYQDFMKSGDFKKMGTDDIVTIIRYDKADGKDTKEMEGALRKKVENARKSGTFTADEARRVNEVLGTNYQPDDSKAKRK
jgi:GGDEF domain-containing protein